MGFDSRLSQQKPHSQDVVKVIASVEYPLVIQKILSHLNTKNDEGDELLPPQSKAPPQISLFE
jgi:hypothetical protein